MTVMIRRLVLIFLLSLPFIFGSSMAVAALTKGIYISQTTFEDTKYLNYLIQRSKKVGINTFIVDIELPNKRYQNNVALLKSNGIQYVARVIVFPDGGTPEQLASIPHREKKYNLVKAALSYGAEQIQLDYIRFNTKQPASPQHAQKVLQVIDWFKTRLAQQSIPLQVDVFGIASFGEEKHIGHDIKLFSQSVNAVCPMVYPSHFEPYKKHAVTPQETVYDAMMAIREQFDNKPLPFKLIPYIELSNYRYPLSTEKRLQYIHAQIKGAEKAGVDGWYAWSPNNLYDNLFKVLETKEVK